VKILIDTNVFLDVALQRAPFAAVSEALLRECSNEGFPMLCAWHSVSNLWYILRKQSGRSIAESVVQGVLKATIVPRCGSAEFVYAINLNMPDFEDAMQASVAHFAEADYIATRNTTDFANSPVEARTPGDLLAQI
jgi:predicted nucleic acid-binding protein